MRWRSVSVTSSTPKIGVVPRRGEGVERGRGSKRMEEDSRGQEISVLRFPFSVLLGPSTNKSMAPAISIIIPVADNHCHGSFTISITAYLSP